MNLYIVRLERGTDNPNYSVFYENVSALGAKSVDYGGIKSMCIVKHHMDKETVQIVIENNFPKRRHGVNIEEVTKASLAQHHAIFFDQISAYYLPYDNYPKIKN